MLDISALTVEFGGVRALDGIDLAVGSGEVVALAGPNGSGKTTLFNAISGIALPTAGQIRLDGHVVTGLAPHVIARRGVARALQHPRPYGRMTVSANLRAAWTAAPHGWADLLGLDRATQRACGGAVEQALALVGLAAHADVPASELSLADRRRLNLAQAVVRDPALLLLDEPAGGLSAEETEAMAELLRTRVLPGRTALVVDHDLGLLGALCRRLVVFEAGRKIADGTHETLLRDSVVRQCLIGETDA
jgi:branched-chain amino acid transport system ATP-binding protein